MKSDRHCDDSTLLQHVRGQVTTELLADVEAHLARCAQCKSKLELYDKINSLFADEARFAPPPEWLVETVSRFRSTEFVMKEPPLTVFAELAFDSLGAGAEGIRADELAERYLVMESKDYVVDIMLEKRDQKLIGQVKAKRPEQRDEVSEIAVEMHCAGQRVSTTTNVRGEFILKLTRAAGGDPLELLFRFPEQPYLAALFIP